MGQSVPLHWWEIVAGILSIPTAIIGLVYAYVLVKKTLLDSQKTKLEIAEKEKKLGNKKNSANNLNNKKRNGEFLDVMLIYLLMPFSSESNDPAKKVSLYFSVIVEFIFLCGFLYASVSYFADYFALLDPSFITPPALQNYGIRFMFSAIGVTLYLGLVFFDIQGVNKFFGKKFENKKMAGFIITTTLLLQIILEIMIGVSRYRLMVSSPEVLAMLETISNIGISLIAIPVLISTSLAARGIYAIALFLAFIVYIVKIFFVRSGSE